MGCFGSARCSHRVRTSGHWPLAPAPWPLPPASLASLAPLTPGPWHCSVRCGPRLVCRRGTPLMATLAVSFSDIKAPRGKFRRGNERRKRAWPYGPDGPPHPFPAALISTSLRLHLFISRAEQSQAAGRAARRARQGRATRQGHQAGPPGRAGPPGTH